MKTLQRIYLIEKSSVDNIRRIRFLIRYKYPKLALLLVSIAASYYLFKHSPFGAYVAHLQALSFFGVFLSGLLFSFGFTAPFAVGFFILAQPSNIYFAAVIGGFGAFISDMVIFKFIRISFVNEFTRLKSERPIKRVNRLIRKRLGLRVSTYLLYFLAGILISSPLPDEIGVILLAGLTTIKPKILGIVSFVLNTVGVFVIFVLSSL